MNECKTGIPEDIDLFDCYKGIKEDIQVNKTIFIDLDSEKKRKG